MQKLAKQAYQARIKVKKSALLIEDRHYFELNNILDEFENFEFGKKRLIALRKLNQNEYIDEQQIRHTIDNNAAIKNRLLELLLDMMGCLKRQIITKEEPNNCITQVSHP